MTANELIKYIEGTDDPQITVNVKVDGGWSMPFKVTKEAALEVLGCLPDENALDVSEDGKYEIAAYINDDGHINIGRDK